MKFTVKSKEYIRRRDVPIGASFRYRSSGFEFGLGPYICVGVPQNWLKENFFGKFFEIGQSGSVFYAENPDAEVEIVHLTVET